MPTPKNAAEWAAAAEAVRRHLDAVKSAGQISDFRIVALHDDGTVEAEIEPWPVLRRLKLRDAVASEQRLRANIERSEALAILRKANDRGEVGYAHGGADLDWPAVQYCLDRDWLVFKCDASIGGHGDPLGRTFQQRTIYTVTRLGREALAKVAERASTADIRKSAAAGGS